jgi:hypothetical protein
MSEREMGKVEPELEVKTDIEPGESSPAQKKAWLRFWQKMVAEAKVESGIGKPVARGVECEQQKPEKEDGQ